ncbi:MAG: hypothetical protein ACPGUV_12740 [Polyangiales bacterium]
MKDLAQIRRLRRLKERVQQHHASLAHAAERAQHAERAQAEHQALAVTALRRELDGAQDITAAQLRLHQARTQIALEKQHKAETKARQLAEQARQHQAESVQSLRHARALEELEQRQLERLRAAERNAEMRETDDRNAARRHT